MVNVVNVDPVVTLTGPSSVAEGSTHTYSYTTTDDGTPETFTRDAQCCDGGTVSGATFSSATGAGSFDCTLRQRRPDRAAERPLRPVNEGSTAHLHLHRHRSGRRHVHGRHADYPDCGDRRRLRRRSPRPRGRRQLRLHASPMARRRPTSRSGHRLRRRLRHRHRERVVVTSSTSPRSSTLTGPSPVDEGSTHTYSYTTTDDRHPETFSRRRTVAATAARCSGATFNSATGAGSFDCSYADGPSSHNPSVTVSDGDGGSDSDSVAVTVTNVAPTIAISGNANVNEGSLYTPHPGRGHRPGHRHRHQLRRPLGRRQHDTYCDATARRRTPTPTAPTTATITVDLVDEDGTFLDAANALSVHVVNVAPRSRSAARRT